MRVAIVIEKFDPAGGGNERSTDQIAHGLIARGHRVTILTSRAPKPLKDLLPEGGQVIVHSGFGTKYALGLVQFARWAERKISNEDFDVSLSMTTAIAASVIQPRGGTVRETLMRNLAMRRTAWQRIRKKASIGLSPKQLTLLAAEHRSLNHRNVKKVIAISHYVTDQLFNYYAVPARRVAYIPNAAEVEKLNPVDRQIMRRRIRDSLAIENDDVAFLFSARNLSLKGLPYLLEAFVQLYAENPQAKLMIAGVLDYPAMKPLEKLGLTEAVRWVGPTRRVDALYAAADVTVLPTWYDPSSKVVLESLLHGVPAISTLYNGASQWILSPSGRVRIPSPFDTRDMDNVHGDAQPAGRVISEPRDIEALTSAMADMMDRAMRRRCAAASVGLHQKISMEKHIEKLEVILQSVADAGSSPHTTDALDTEI